MKKLYIFFSLIAILFIVFFSCQQAGGSGSGGNDDDDDGGDGGETPDLFAGITKRDMVSITGGTYIQQSDENEDGDVLDVNESFSHTITGFQMAKYEVTYELWYTVHNWALSNGYTFANPGREGRYGVITDPEGAVPTAAKYEPVTTINWRDAMVWCNAHRGIAAM